MQRLIDLQRFYSFIFIVFAAIELQAQTGPGGVGNTLGATGQPANLIWLDASRLEGIITSGNSLNSWPDISGNNIIFNTSPNESSGDPSYFSNQINGLGIVRFETGDRIVVNPYNQFPASGITFFSVFLSSGAQDSYVSYAVGAGPLSNEFLLYDQNNQEVYIKNSGVTGGGSFGDGNFRMLSTLWDNAVGTNTHIYRDGTLTSTGEVQSGNTFVNGGSLVIGSNQGDIGESFNTDQDFNGDVAEMIFFSGRVNEAQRIIVENYLAEKYGLTIANDYYVASNPNYRRIIGIGYQNGGVHQTASQDGLTLGVYDGTLDANGEFLFTSHCQTSNSVVTDSLGTGVEERWLRNWYIQKSGTFNASITFDFSEAISGGLFPQDVADYVLLRRNGASYEQVTVAAKSIVGDRITFNIASANLSNGHYTLGTLDAVNSPALGLSVKTWYSYKNGNWQDPTVWSLDGSLAPLYLNPANEIPSNLDKVVITNGRTVNMRNVAGNANLNNITINQIEVVGTLNIGTSFGHNFGSIKGRGTIQIEGSSVDDSDNFPSGTTTEFASATGGLLEIRGDGMTMNTGRTMRNVRVNLSSGSINLLSNWTINNDFTIQSGNFIFNNNSATTIRNLTVFGNVVISSGATMNVGTGNARHEFNFHGNFTNNGTAYFTNRVSATYGSEATNGIVDANFLSDDKDQFVQCNGVTRFYRIEIDKGSNDTYTLHLDASAAGNFLLFGFANQGHAEIEQLTTNTNALGLIYGTVRLGTHVTVPQLNNSGNYNISTGAKLWVDGGSATKSAGTAIVPYGTILVSGGTLTSSVGSGITTRGNGFLEVQGGTVTLYQFRTSVFGSTNQGGYKQSGGQVSITSQASNNDFYALSLTYEGNTFSMTGGTLTVRPNTRGGIFINGDVSNFNVSGGTIIGEMHNTNNFVITSRAPFYNLTIRKFAGGASQAIVNGGTSANATSEPRTLTIQPLNIINDLVVLNSPNNATFNSNGAQVSIQGDLQIQTGATFTPGSSPFIFYGAGNSGISFPVASTITLSSLQINKNFSDQSLQILSGNATTALQINGELSVLSGKFDLGSYNVSARSTIILSDTIGVTGNTGRIIMNGASAQVIDSDESAITNLEIANANGVSLTGSTLAVENQLTLTTGIFNINTKKLVIDNAVAGGPFDATRMIQTAGNVSDGGLEYYFDGLTANPPSVVFPLGTNANSIVRYTPVSLDLNAVADDGFVRIRTSDTELQTVDLSALSNNLLTYYWRISHREFSTLPTVSSVVFTAVNNDIPGGGPGFSGTYVPGKVLDQTPYTRSQELSGNISGQNITFNGGGSGFNLENANYTAGDGTTNLFVGQPTVYYNRRGGGFGGRNWNVNTSWYNAPTGTTNPPDFPEAGDIVVIRGDFGTTAINVNGTQAAAEIIFIREGTYEDIESLPRLRFVPGNQLTVGKISGVGDIYLQYNTTTSPVLNGDIGEFAANDTSLVEFYMTQNGTYNVASANFFSVLPTLRIYGQGSSYNRTVSFNYDVSFKNLIIDGQAVLRVGGNYDIDNRTRLGFTGGGRILFPNGANAYTLSTGELVTGRGKIQQDNDYRVLIETGGGNGIEHVLEVKRDVNLDFNNQDGTLTFDLYSNFTDNNVILKLSGEGDFAFIDGYPNGNSTIELYKIQLAKTNSSNTFTFSDDFVIPSATASFKPVELTNGILIFDDPGINVVAAAGGSNFSIPAVAGLEITQGTVSISGSNTGLKLDGLLRINGGTFNMDDAVNNGNNFIEYGNTGTATIEISAGSLIVGSQVRRSANSTDGSLKYRQTGGTVTLGTRSAPVTNRSIFEIVNSGSEFTHTGGTLTFQRGVNSLTVPTILLEPSTFNLTGSSIVLGNANTPAGTASDRMGIKSNVSLYNLTVNNAGGNNPVARLYSSPLTVVNNLTINAGASLITNSFNLTLVGDFDNDGTYTPGTNTTTFSKTTGTQNYTGSGNGVFYNLNKSGSGTLVIVAADAHNINITNNFNLIAGTFNQNEYAINLEGNAAISGTLLSTGNGLIFNGSIPQQLSGISNTNVNLGTLTIDNIEGVEIPDGFGYQFTITANLRMSSGLLSVGSSLLTIGKQATITAVNSFSAANMIQTNSSFTDNGVRKIFNGTENTFTFPVGELKYTPMSLSLTTIDEDATITVRPANEIHPAVTDDSSTPTYNEQLNVLTYHWILKSTGISGSSVGNAIFSYDQVDVALSGNNPATGLPWAETNYVAARLTSGGYLWDKAFQSPVNTVENTVTVPVAQSAIFQGEYTAGVNNAFRAVPVFRSNGNVTLQNGENWQRSDDGGLTYPVDLTGSDPAPVGAIIAVQNGHTLLLDVNNVRLLATEIEDGAILEIDPNATGIRLGEVSGLGTLRLSNNIFPAGNYESFLSCSGGGLDFTGNTNYQVMSGISQVRNLTLSGTGERELAFNIINVCNDLTINGPSVTKDNFTSVQVEGDFILESGSFTLETSDANITIVGNTILNGGVFQGFTNSPITLGGNLDNSGGGTFTSNGSSVLFNGSQTQNILGTFNLNRVTINNTGGGLNLTTGSGGTINIAGALVLTDGIVTTAASNLVTITSTGSYTGGSLASYFNGPVTKQSIAALSNYTFPVGKGGRYAPVSISNVGTGGQNWTAEYFTAMGSFSASSFDDQDPGSGFNALIRVQSTDRWQVESSGGNSAFVRLTYGSHNAFENSESIRVVRWDATEITPRWENQGGIASGTNASGTIISEENISFSSQQFALGYAPETMLPVEWVYFISNLEETGISLDWATATETNNSHFEIEHSVNGIDFNYIGQVTGHGTTAEPKEYLYLHQSPKNGFNYYRLRQVDFDGEFEYSPIVYQIWSTESLVVNVYPNPVVNWLTIQINQQANGNYDLYSMSGRLVNSGNIENVNSITMDVSELPIGLYTLRLNINNSTQLIRVIKN